MTTKYQQQNNLQHQENDGNWEVGIILIYILNVLLLLIKLFNTICFIIN